MTCNALEVVAQNHSDCLLPLDELAQADSKAISDCIYMLANNEGKRRLRSEIVLRTQHHWRTLILSTGEIDIATKITESNRRAFAGMEVRFVSLPANCDIGYGIFEDLHGFKNGDQLSKYLKDACGKYYGTAIQKYLEQITNDLEFITTNIKKNQQEFKVKYILENSSRQVAIVASRFGLIAPAGELTIGFGILPILKGDEIKAIAKCFKAWGNERGNTIDGVFTNKNAIIYALNNLLIDKVLLKFKYIFYEALKLAGILTLTIFSRIIFALWIRQRIVNDNPYPKLTEPKIEPSPKISAPVNEPEFIPTEEPNQFIKVKNL